jgi:purine-binding chemotaxis protein CheW
VPAGRPDAPASVLRIVIGGRRYAAALRDIRELVRMPALAPVPLGPPCLAGLMSHRGAALPVVDTATLMGVAARAATGASRVLVGAMGVGFVVDRVESGAAARTPGDGDAHDDKDDADRKDDGQVIDLAELVRARMPLVRQASRPPGAAAGRRYGHAGRPAAEATRALLGFTAGGLEYAFAMDAVQAVACVRPDGTGSSSAEWRGVTLPLVFLARTLGAGGTRTPALVRVAILRLPGGGLAGAVVDGFTGILQVPLSHCHPVPPLLVGGRAGGVETICRLDGGARLVCVLSPAQVLQGAAVAPVRQAARAAARPETSARPPGRFIVYRVGPARFAAAMSGIDAVLRRADGLAPVPGGPAAVAGMLRYRGGALPIIDAGRLLGLAPLPGLPRAPDPVAGRILVQSMPGSMGGSVAGFAVDAVEGVRTAGLDELAAPPDLPAASAALVTHILAARDGAAPLPVLDLRRLLDAGDAIPPASWSERLGVSWPRQTGALAH